MQVRDLSINLKKLRIARGMTMNEAAKAAGISRMAYHNIEKGIAEPRVSNLQKLANALKVKVFDLVRPVPELHSVRFRALKWKTKKSKEQREEIKNRIAVWMRDFNDLEKILGEQAKKRSSAFCEGPGEKHSSPIEAAKNVRKRFGLDEDEIITDICGLIESRGIKLHFIEVRLDDVSGLSVKDKELGCAIIVNKHAARTAERKIFTIAHELGHIVLHPASFNDGGTEIQSQEKEADIFASHFLMPRKAFRKRLNEVRGADFVDAILHMKGIFRVSYEVVLYRLIDEKIVDSGIWKTFRIKYKQRASFNFTGRREPEPLAEFDCIADHLNRLIRDAYEKELISISRAAEILEKSVVEMRELINGWMAVK